MIEQALILAGGRGERLRPLTDEIPKPMIPISGRPFLEYLIRYLKGLGVRRVVLATGYGKETIRRHLGDGAQLGIQISYSEEEMPMGTGGALRLASDLLEESFILVNGDTFLVGDLLNAAGIFKEREPLGMIILFNTSDRSSYGSVVLDEEGYVSSFTEKGLGTGPGLINTGYYFFHKVVVKEIPAGQPYSLERALLPRLCHRILGHVVEGYFIDIGTYSSYQQFQHDFSQLRRFPLAKDLLREISE